MAVEYNPLKMALIMMESALSILDDAGDRATAVHLQHAIDVFRNEPVGAHISDADETFDSPVALNLMKRSNHSGGS